MLKRCSQNPKRAKIPALRNKKAEPVNADVHKGGPFSVRDMDWPEVEKRIQAIVGKAEARESLRQMKFDRRSGTANTVNSCRR